MSTFEAAIPVILEHEGGWVDNPADRGGETNFGIALKMIVRYLHLQPADLGLPNFAPGCMRALKKDVAVQLYSEHFWAAHRLGIVEDQGAATKLFDVLVNMPLRAAIICAQRACGAQPDGVLGPQTFASINSMSGNFERALASTMAARYREIAATNPTQQGFLENWLIRAACTSATRCRCHPHHHP